MTFLLAATGRKCTHGWPAALEALSVGTGLEGGELARPANALARLAAVCPPDLKTASVQIRRGRIAVIADGPDLRGGGLACTVAEAYASAGQRALVTLRYEGTFVLWDEQARCLWVGCDEVGLRAPAYFWDGETFVLASRATCLLHHRAVASAWDEAYLAHALAGLWCGSPSSTAFRGIQRIAPGELLCVSTGRLDRAERASATDRLPPRRDREGVLVELERRLDRAVREAACDGSCVAVSGGVDSSLIAAAFVGPGRPADAFTVVAPEGENIEDGTRTLVDALPGLRLRRIVATAQREDDRADLPDDPILSGPAFQPARRVLYHAARAHGFARIIDGEGGDELFEIGWLVGDLLRVGAFSSVAKALARPMGRRRALRDLALGGLLGPISAARLARARASFREHRPWVRAELWNSAAFARAWDDAIVQGRHPRVVQRLPVILGTYGRSWRAARLERVSAGIEACSPFLAPEVVSFVRSLHPSVAMDVRHDKWLLRSLAARRLPPAIAWRPKNEPLNDWLIGRALRSDSTLERIVGHVRANAALRDRVDPDAMIAAVQTWRAEASPRGADLVELFSIVEWVAAVGARHSL
jgi:asparagine synthase (glutamine-hydrolysing)